MVLGSVLCELRLINIGSDKHSKLGTVNKWGRLRLKRHELLGSEYVGVPLARTNLCVVPWDWNNLRRHVGCSSCTTCTANLKKTFVCESPWNDSEKGFSRDRLPELSAKIKNGRWVLDSGLNDEYDGIDIGVGRRSLSSSSGLAIAAELRRHCVSPLACICWNLVRRVHNSLIDWYSVRGKCRVW